MDSTTTAFGSYLLGAGVIAWISRKPLRKPGSHGFYRFFAWQGILALFALHHPMWGYSPIAAQPFIASFLMISSLSLVALGWLELRRKGKASIERADDELFGFEKTTALVTSGVFNYIRHPMYASLLLLAWGAYWQRPTLAGIPIAFLTTGFLFLTAHADERECQAYFGTPYDSYKKRSWAFLPFVY